MGLGRLRPKQTLAVLYLLNCKIATYSNRTIKDILLFIESVNYQFLTALATIKMYR